MKDRLAQKAIQDAAIRDALRKQKARERATDRGCVKRKEVDELSRFVNLHLLDSRAIRSGLDYRARHYSLEKQVLGFVNHLLVRYPVPGFLYRTVLSVEGLRLVFGDVLTIKEDTSKFADWAHRDWFIALAQGQSFVKLCADKMTRKEANIFLRGRRDLSISQNILWAKATACGFSEAGCRQLVKNLDRRTLKRVGDRLPDMLRIVGSMTGQFKEVQIRETIWFLLDEAFRDPHFSLEGRTGKSLYQMVDEYYRDTFLSDRIRRVFWSKHFHTMELDNGVGGVFRFAELNSSAELQKEGKHQQHCVLSFLPKCREGKTKIVSARSVVYGTELTRLTIEVDMGSRRIMQVAGRYNRRTTHNEIQIVHRWARAQGLVCDPDADWMLRGVWAVN